jgi:hypothetical protein
MVKALLKKGGYINDQDNLGAIVTRCASVGVNIEVLKTQCDKGKNIHSRNCINGV